MAYGSGLFDYFIYLIQIIVRLNLRKFIYLIEYFVL